MPTIVKTDSGNWKAVIRKTGFPTATKTFRLKRDAENWARRAEDEMVRVTMPRAADDVQLRHTPSRRSPAFFTPASAACTRLSLDRM
jgi:hypothetical protein